MTFRPDKTAAERQRRYRLRRRCGLRVEAIEIDPDTLSELTRRGLIAREDLTDRHRLAAALGSALDALVFS